MSSMATAMKSISYSKATIKTLRRMPRNVADLFGSKVEAYAEDPAWQANSVKALKGRERVQAARRGPARDHG
jgi:mRNA interferase RelE/StbE